MYSLTATSLVKPTRIASAVSAVLLAATMQSAMAQSNENNAQNDADEDIEVITVASERRVKRVQDISASLTALSSADLERKAVERLDDLQFASPGLTVTDAGITQSVNIRGIGLASGDPDVTNGVGTYIDGLFQPPIVSTLNFYDVEYIQVLRGPQGTFAGSNSTGGAIMVNSRRPDVDGGFEGNVLLGVGNYNTKRAQAALNLPVAETFAARVAVNYENRDSFYDSIGTEPTTAGSLDEKSARVGLLWAPTDGAEVYVKYETTDKSNGGFAWRPLANTEFAEGRTDDIRELSYNTDSYNNESADTLLLDVSYEFANGITAKWVSGDQVKEIDNMYDYDGSSIGDSTQKQVVREDQVSHEFNLISPDEGVFTWVVGAYYQKNEILVDIDNGPFPVEINLQNEKITKGVFGQVGYDINDDLSLEVGLRKAWFEAGILPGAGVVIGRGIPGFPEGGIPVAQISGDYEDDEMMGKVSVNYAPNKHNNFYAYVAKGYKPGGINSETSSFEPEKVIAYEAGWKGSLIDGQLQPTIAVFYSDYENFQNTNLDITTGRNEVYNVAEATINGVELALNAHFDYLRLDFSASYVNSDLEPTQPIVNTRLPGLPDSPLPQCSGGLDPSSGACFDYGPYLATSDGGNNLYAPEFSFTAGAEYLFELPNGAFLTPRINYAWVDEQWTSLLYNPTTDLLDSRGLWSALITYEQDDWKVQGYARNLTDKEYITGQNLDANTEFYGAPRTIGVDVSYQF